MGGHGGLNILPQKRWHLYRHDNRLRVQRDEERHREEESRQRQQQEQKSMSDILILLKRRKVEATTNASKQVTRDSSLTEETSHRTDLSPAATASQSGVHTPPEVTAAVSTTVSDSPSSSSISELSSSSSFLHAGLSSSSFSHSSTASSLPSTSPTLSSSSSSSSIRRLSPSPHSDHTSSSSSFSSSAAPASSPSSLSSSRKKFLSTSSSSLSQFPETFSGGESLGGFLGEHEEEGICGGLLPLDDEETNSIHRGEDPQVYPQVGTTVGKIIRIRSSLPPSSSSSSLTPREEMNRLASSAAVAQSGGSLHSQSIPKTSWMRDIPSSALSFSKVIDKGTGGCPTIGQSHPSSSTLSTLHSMRKGSSSQSGGESRHINFFAEEEKELEKLEAKRQKYLQEAGYTPNARSEFDQIIRVSLHQKPWYHCPPSGAYHHHLPSSSSSSCSSRQTGMKSIDTPGEDEREKLLQLRRIEASAVVANLIEEKRLQMMSGDKETLNKLRSHKEGAESQVLSSRFSKGGIIPGVCTPGMTMKGMVFEEEEDRDSINKVDLLSIDTQDKQKNDLEKKKKKENAPRGHKEKRMKDKKKEKKKKDRKRRKDKSRTSLSKDEERRRRRLGYKEREEDIGETSICLVTDDEASLVIISDEDSSSSVYCEEDEEEEEERESCLIEDDALEGEQGRGENKRGGEKHNSTGMKKEEREEGDQDDILLLTEEQIDEWKEE